MHHLLRLAPAALFPLSALLIALTLPATAHAAPLAYNESLHGDLSDLGSAPTPLTFDVGVNTIVGTMGGPPDAEPDVFTFTLAPNTQITSIYLTLDPAERSFVAIAAGTSIEMDSAENHLSNLLTFDLGEILDDLSSAAFDGTSTLPSPIPAGTYTFWLQEVSTNVDYTLSFTVASTAIPEPSAFAALAGLGALGFAAHRRRR